MKATNRLDPKTVTIWRCIHRASSYNMYINRYDLWCWYTHKLISEFVNREDRRPVVRQNSVRNRLFIWLLLWHWYMSDLVVLLQSYQDVSAIEKHRATSISNIFVYHCDVWQYYKKKNNRGRSEMLVAVNVNIKVVILVSPCDLADYTLHQQYFTNQCS